MSIPIENIYYLLCYAWNRLEERDLVNVLTTDCRSLLDLFGRVLLHGMTHLLKRGLDRGYLRHAEEGRCLRGKLGLATTVKRDLLRLGEVYCEFDELSHNVLHNQIIRTTLRELAGHPKLDESLRADLLGVYRHLHGIETVQLSAILFARVQLSRNNAFYGFLLNVCEMLYTHVLAREGNGDYKFQDFLRDEARMAALFQDFVTNFYRHELRSVRGSPP